MNDTEKNMMRGDAPDSLRARKTKPGKWRLMSMASALCLIVALSSCASKSYDDIIPKDSPAVAEIDFAGMAGKVGSSAENSAKALTQLLPFASALDLSVPAYFFVSPNEYYGMAFSVADENKLEKTLKETKDIVVDKKSGDLSWAVWDGSWQMAWNDDALLILGPSTATEQPFMHRTMTAMFRSEEGMTDGDIYPRLQQMKGDIKLVAAADIMPSAYRALLTAQLPQNVDVSDVRIASDISFADSQIKAENLLEPKQKDSGITFASPGSKEYSGRLQPNKDEQALVTMYSGIAGNDLLKRLRSDKSMRAVLVAMNADIEADKMLGNINGDVVMRLKNIASDGSMLVSLKAELSNSDFMKNVPAWQKRLKGKRDRKISVMPDGTCSYVNADKRFDFKVQNNVLDCEYGDAKAFEMNKAQSAAGGNAAPKKNVMCFAQVDCGALSAQPFIKGLVGGKLSKFLQSLKSATFTSRDAQHSTLLLNSKYPNALQYLFGK